MSNKVEKSILVKNFQEKSNFSSCLFIVNYTGVNADVMYNFRKDLNIDCKVKFNVIKNKLIKIIISGGKFDSVVDFLKGQNGFIFAEDPLAVSRVLNKFCLQNKKMKFISCCIDNIIYDASYIEKLSKLRSLPELRAQLLATLNFVGSSLLRTISEPSMSLVRTCNARSEEVNS